MRVFFVYSDAISASLILAQKTCLTSPAEVQCDKLEHRIIRLQHFDKL